MARIGKGLTEDRASGRGSPATAGLSWRYPSGRSLDSAAPADEVRAACDANVGSRSLAADEAAYSDYPFSDGLSNPKDIET